MDDVAQEPVEPALHAYVAAIADHFGVPPAATSCEVGGLATAYIGLGRCLSDFPHRDIALVWDERLGWAAAVETASGQNRLVFSYLGASAVPHVELVTSFVHELIAGRDLGQTSPPFFARRDDLARKLAAATRGVALSSVEPVPSPAG